jgi:hypothetical protein
MRELMINSALTHSMLLVLPILCALLLRWARCPGWSVVGGVAAGLVLGPGILGAVMPVEYERMFIGGVEEREAVDQIERRMEQDRAVLLEKGATPGEITAHLDEQFGDEHRARQAALEEARWSFQRPFRSYTSAVIALTLLGAGLVRINSGDRRQGAVTPVSIGLWSALLPGGLAFSMMLWFWADTVSHAVLAGAAVAIGPWVLRGIDRRAADEAEFGGARMLQFAGRIASVIAIIAAVWALSEQRAWAGFMWCAPLLALPVGWMFPGLRSRLPASRRADDEQTARTEPPRPTLPFIDTIVRNLLDIALVPSLAACATLRINPFLEFAFWPFLAFVLLSGDARWLGAFLGAMLPGGRRGLRTMRLVLGSMACGPTQLAITALASHQWALSGPILFALICGAVIIEVTAPLRRSLSRRLIETEAELDELRGED